MRGKGHVFGWMAALVLVGAAVAEPAPEEVREVSWLPSGAALEALGELRRDRLMDRGVFADTLAGVVTRDDLSAADRADVLAVMLHAIDGRFNGTVWLPPGEAYVDVYWGLAERLAQTRDRLAGLDVEVDDLVDLVKRTHARDATRSGHALLLLAVLDPDAAASLVGALAETDRLKRSQVPPIAIHYATLAAALIGHDELMGRWLALLDEIPFEESREDILCAAAFRSPSPETLASIGDFVRGQAASDVFDLDGHTGLIVLRRRMDTQDFAALLDALMEAAHDERRREDLKVYRTGEAPRGGMGEPPNTAEGGSSWLVKQWDGFRVTYDNQGVSLRWGEVYRDYVPR